MTNQAKFGETSFSIGDTVKVYQKIKEAGKTRVQAFQGVVIAIKGKEENKTFTVRKVGAGGIGVERIWPLFSPHISKIQVVRKGKVRRAKLYYLRKRVGKKAIKVKERKIKKVAKVSSSALDTPRRPISAKRRTSGRASHVLRGSVRDAMEDKEKNEEKKPRKSRRESSGKISGKKRPKTS